MVLGGEGSGKGGGRGGEGLLNFYIIKKKTWAELGNIVNIYIILAWTVPSYRVKDQSGLKKNY